MGFFSSLQLRSWVARSCERRRSGIKGNNGADAVFFRGFQTSMSDSLYSGGCRRVLLFDAGSGCGGGRYIGRRRCSVETHPPLGASSALMVMHSLKYFCLARSACRFRYQKKMTMARSKTTPAVDYKYRIILHLPQEIESVSDVPVIPMERAMTLYKYSFAS